MRSDISKMRYNEPKPYCTIWHLYVHMTSYKLMHKFMP